MTCGAYINPWIAGALLSTSVLIGQEISAHDWEVTDKASRDVGLRLEPGSDLEVVSEFGRRLQQYDGMGRRLDAVLPIAAVSDNAATIRNVVSAHNRALRSARYEARQGDLFFKDVSSWTTSRTPWFHLTRVEARTVTAGERVACDFFP